jgi:hypothetical protein
MAISFPRIDLPWTRKTPLQRAQAELKKVQKDVQKEAQRIERSKIALPKVKAEDVGAAVEETRRAAVHGMEDVAGQAAVVATKLGREASKFGKKAGKRGRELSTELAQSGEKNLRTLGKDLRGLTDDVKHMRITREKRRPSMMPGIALLAGLGTGLATMYFFDPEQGRRRRALLRDQLIKWSRVTTETVNGQVKDLRNRSAGLAHEVRRSISGDTDEALEEAAEKVAIAVGEAAPDASTDLAATDKAATTAAAGEPKTGRRRSTKQTAYGEVATETWGEVTVPEGQEGQPDLARNS